MPEIRTPHLQDVERINKAISKRRHEFVAEYKAKTMGSRALTYEPALDRGTYQILKQYEDQGSAYEHVKNNLNAYTTFQVETFIGERLNVGLSEFRYDLRDGILYGKNMDVSLIDMIKRGRDCRDEVVKDIDKPRQQAEVEQFKKIQDVLGNPKTDLETTVISISPPGGEGSAYSHNFYDVFVLKQDDKTHERYVLATRFASELTLDEYKEKARELSPGYLQDYTGEHIDSYFLSHPLVLDKNSELSGNPDRIHENFHKDHEFLSIENFGEVKRVIAGLITSYVNTLVATPDDELFLNTTLNAIMNKADVVADQLRHPQGRRVAISNHQEIQMVIPPRSEIYALGKQPVRETTTGCGSSSGFDTEDRKPSNMSSFSSVDLGTDKFGSRTFTCPECGEVNVRPVNELLGECQHCSSKKVAC